MGNVYKQLVVVLPSYNESQNLKILLPFLFRVSSDVHVIIVDDSSQQENKKIQQIVAKYTNISLITRSKKSGRGSAVLDGFRYASKKKEYQYFVEMDTDLAHSPHELPDFVSAVQQSGVGLVIGSRYINKSKIVQWPKRRLIQSKIINVFLNTWLGLNVHDYTNGYRLYSRDAVTCLLRADLREKNFIALSESAYVLKKHGFSIVEIPITFTDRKHGVSTVGTSELFQCLIGAIRIRFRG